MTPAEYVNEIVLPTVREFRDDRSSRRREYLACIVANHVRDHLGVAIRTAGQAVTAPFNRNEEDNLEVVLRGICNGVKHVGLDRRHRYPFRPGTQTGTAHLWVREDLGELACLAPATLKEVARSRLDLDGSMCMHV